MTQLRQGQIGSTALALMAYRRGDNSDEAMIGALLEAQIFYLLVRNLGK
jgi:hypothetical protein